MYQVSDSCIKYQDSYIKYKDSCIRYQSSSSSIKRHVSSIKQITAVLCKSQWSPWIKWENLYFYVYGKITLFAKIFYFLPKFSEGGTPSRKFYSERVLLLLPHVCPNYIVSKHSIKHQVVDKSIQKLHFTLYSVNKLFVVFTSTLQAPPFPSKSKDRLSMYLLTGVACVPTTSPLDFVSMYWKRKDYFLFFIY